MHTEQRRHRVASGSSHPAGAGFQAGRSVQHLDPDRYADYATFLAETEAFVGVAAVAEHLQEEKPLKPREHAALKRIFQRDPEALARHLAALETRTPGARETLLRTLVDQHGPGRVMFRNTRAAMAGFPKRKFCPAPLAGADATLLARCARELEAEETGGESGIRYSYKDDPRLKWLAGYLRKHRTAKVLLICRSQRKVAAIAAALQEIITVKTGLFHEGLPLVALLSLGGDAGVLEEADQPADLQLVGDAGGDDRKGGERLLALVGDGGLTRLVVVILSLIHISEPTRPY